MVLPAPLGPIRPTSSLLANNEVEIGNAVRPPNRIVHSLHVQQFRRHALTAGFPFSKRARRSLKSPCGRVSISTISSSE